MAVLRSFGPKRGPFFIPRLAQGVVATAVLCGAALLGALILSLWPLLLLLPVIAVGILAPTAYGAHVAWRKERYELHPRRLVCEYGGLLSDGRSELEVRNITHIRLRLPWLRHRFFKVGDVRVESAGSAASEITFRSIVDPEAVFEEIKTLMRNNGYALRCGERLHEESPTALGALTDVGQKAVGAVFALVWIGFGGLSVVAGVAEAAGGLSAVLVSVAALGVAVATAVFGLGGVVVRYLDITRRTYTVYDDAVAYTEGFLTRDNAVIPYENIADAAVRRTFVDQIVGLYDVSVSCQGSGSEIWFRRLSGGPALKEAIRKLVSAAAERSRAPAPEVREDEAEGVDGAEAPVRPERAARRRAAIDPSQVWTAELQMNLVRALVPLSLLLPAFPVWLLASVGVIIQASRTRYVVGRDSIMKSFSFIGSNQQEFAYDKVTGVQVTRTPVDTWLGTLTVQVWSIGSPQPLTLAHVAADAVDLPALLRQCGIPTDAEPETELAQSFTGKAWLIQTLPLLVVLGGLSMAIAVAALLIEGWLLLLAPLPLVLLPISAVVSALRVKRQRITLHREHLEARTGLWFRNHVSARYDNLKKVETVAIPLTDQGTFTVYVAGERMVQQQEGQGAPAGGLKLPYTIQGIYIDHIADRVDAMDALLLGQLEASAAGGPHRFDSDDGMRVKPAVANAVVPLIVVGLFLWPLLLFVPLVVWHTKVREYVIGTERIVHRSGIFFKSTTSVLFDRIDSLQQHQGALGKAFGNGRVTLLTAGSSAPDLVVANVPDHGAVYAAIRERYGRQAP